MNSGNIISAVLGTILKVVVTIAVIFVIYRGATACYDYGYRIFTEPAVSTGEGRTVTVAITKDMSASEIGRMLEQKGLVKDAKLFSLQYLLSEFRKDVKPGVFELSTAMTAEEMMEAMASSGESDETDKAADGKLQPKESGTADTQETEPGENDAEGNDPQGAGGE